MRLKHVARLGLLVGSDQIQRAMNQKNLNYEIETLNSGIVDRLAKSPFYESKESQL